jgi:hypothetical protein
MALFREILRYQNFTVEQFKDAYPREHRHPIEFLNSNEPTGFPAVKPSLDDLWTGDPWQFGLQENENDAYYSKKWRVHGFISDDTYYIVWLDPDHKLNPKPYIKQASRK